MLVCKILIFSSVTLEEEKGFSNSVLPVIGHVPSEQILTEDVVLYRHIRETTYRTLVYITLIACPLSVEYMYR